ncbi:uncharacterized protein HD556DRAFT_1308288 [Suillus plorans]|uniref:Uncharacterized protein n=1 Tax=Suillus plorans TaxID=116603 RepID=A0A9P7AQ81_9AGAM|nr:uncharacterized protein HD556DRAFT_1308288 [Suillus plorans]KAG1794239.1 hypothetical protein HD556DRAFT_1308288 [Suillus plorans]
MNLKAADETVFGFVSRKKEEISIKMAAKYRTKKIVSQVIDSGCQVSGASPSKKKRICIQRSSQAEKVVSQIMGSGEPSITGPPTPPHHSSSSASGGHIDSAKVILWCRCRQGEPPDLFNIQHTEYIQSSHRGKSHLSAAITECLSNLFHRCKLVNAATEELWCYAAASGSFTPQLISINVCVMHSFHVGLHVGLKKKLCFLLGAVGVAVQKCRKNLMQFYTSALRRYSRCPKACG